MDISLPKKHVLMVTFPAFGHMIPLLELAKKISAFHDVTFAMSAAKIPQLKERELITSSDRIQLCPIQDGVVDDFDDPNDPTVAHRVFQGVLPAIAALLAEIPVKNEPAHKSTILAQPVDVIIVDHFLGGYGPVCYQRGVPYYIFQSNNALMLRVLLGLNDDSPTQPDAEADPFSRLPVDGKPAPIPESMKKLLLPMRNTMHLAAGYVLNSVRDIEVESSREVGKDPSMAGKPVYFVGPLLPDENSKNSTAHFLMEERVTAWLDRQRPSSVVYVSFGSIATPRPEQLKILANALLSVGQPVIWAIREKYQISLPEQITAKIPGQFEDRENRFVIVNWAPQKLILSHESVGVFLSHCGWNSAIEAFSTGTPVVSWPMFADQLLNGQWMEKLGTGLMIPNTGIQKDSRIVPENEIEDIVRKVGGWAGAGHSSYALAAQGIKDKLRAAWLPGGSSYEEFSSLVKFDRPAK